METIFKFPIELGSCEFEAPRFCRVIYAGLDPAGQLCVWAIVIPGNPVTKHRVLTLGTGHGSNDIQHMRHVSTVRDGSFMWHVFVDK